MIGLLGAVGPFAIDMYLPALPEVAADLGASAQATQFTLTAFFVAFGVSQLAYGPLADQYGRKPPLYVGLAIFLLGTLGCALAPSIGTLIAARLVQGLGAATVMVVPRAIIRDLHTGPEATRLMAMVMLVISVSPMLAPLAGSGLMAIGSWRLIFAVLALAGLLEPGADRLRAAGDAGAGEPQPARPAVLARGFWRLLRDPAFMGLTLIGGFSMSSFFVFIASASFVYTQAVRALADRLQPRLRAQRHRLLRRLADGGVARGALRHGAGGGDGGQRPSRRSPRSSSSSRWRATRRCR